MDTNCTFILHLLYNTIPSHHMQDYFPIKRVVNISSVLYYVLCHYFLLLNGYYGQINCYDGSLPFLCFCHLIIWQKALKTVWYIDITCRGPTSFILKTPKKDDFVFFEKGFSMALLITLKAPKQPIERKTNTLL